ncbi:Hemin receptor [Maribacter sp. HTCC2170]|nr:Hemin receptor [Maribacter sp. HTCC2170]
MIALPLHMGFAQNSISGTVTSTEQKEPLEQVALYFPELEKGTTTDSAGYFIFRSIPNGDFELIISSIGFETQSIHVNLNNQEEKTLNISMLPSAIEMEEVIVSTPFHKLQSENVMKVERANLKELKSNGAITLSDGITKIAGVETISTGVGIGKPVIRGLSANRVLVYSQGIRMENQQYGDEHGLGLNEAGIDNVEVIKGPASLLYGSDAMGGVLYFNPEKFALPNETKGDVNMNYYTNTEGVGINAGLATSSEHFKFLVRGGHTSHVDYKTGDGSRLTNSRFRENDLKTGVGYQTTNVTSELRYNLNYSKLGIPEEMGTQTKTRTLAMPFQEISNHMLSSKSKFFLENSLIETTIGYTFNKRKEFEEHHHEEEEEEEEEGHEEEGPALHMNLSTLSYSIQYHLPKWDNLETIVGIQGMNQKNENFGEEMLIPDASTNDIGVLLTSHIHFKDESGLQLGLRYDRRNLDTEATGDGAFENLNLDFNSFNAAIGYKFNVLEHVISRVNFATGFRAPNLAELTSNGTHEGTNRYELGNSDLTHEKNIQTDISLEYSNEHVEFFINGFYNSINDYIFIQPNGTVLEEEDVFEYTQENAELYGGEMGFHIHPHPLDWLHYESSFEMVVGKKKTGDNLPLIPANSLSNTLRFESNSSTTRVKNKYAFITLKSVFDQNKTGEFESATDGYSLLNIGFGGNFSINKTLCEVRLSGNNILDKSYVSHLSRLKVDGINNIGRNISLGVTVNL